MATIALTAPAYTTSKARIGRQTILAIGGVTGATGTETYLGIEELMDATPSGSAWGIVEVTNFQSGPDKEKRKTLRDNGKLTLKYNLLPGPPPGQTALNAAYNDPLNPYDFVLQIAKGVGQTVAGDQYVFSGLVLSVFDFPVTVEGVIQSTCTIEVTGPITVNPGS